MSTKTVLYGHLLRGSVRVKKGQILKNGDEIGIIGNTGYSFGAHLHITLVEGIRSDYWYCSATPRLGGTKAALEAFLAAGRIIKNKLGLRPYEVTAGWGGNADGKHYAIDLVGIDGTSTAGPSIIVWNQDAPGKVLAVEDYGDSHETGKTGVTVFVAFGDAINAELGGASGGGGSAVKYGNYPPGAYEIIDKDGLNVRTAPRRAGKNGDVVHVLPAGTNYQAIEELRSGVDGVWHKMQDGNYICAQLGAEVYVKTVTGKSIDELAREVLRGEWGNGQTRKDRLTAAGYDYNRVQSRVDELI